MDVVSRDIRMAGYMPCRYPDNLMKVVSDGGGSDAWWQGLFDQPMQGYEAGVGIPNEIIAAPDGETLAPGSDAIVIYKTDGFQTRVAGHNPSDTASRINFPDTVPTDVFMPGEIVVMCDSHQAAMFQVWQRNLGLGGVDFIKYNMVGANSPGNCTPWLGSTGSLNCDGGDVGNVYDFQNNARLIKYSPVIYYVAESNSNAGVLALKRRYLQARDNSGIETATMWPEELLQGIESMQIRYGIDTDDDQIANQFLAADAVAAGAWNDVVSVKLGLLLISDDQVATQVDNNTYNVAGESITAAGDRRMRQVANYTISLRNRVRTGLGAIALTSPSEDEENNDDDDDDDDDD